MYDIAETGLIKRDLLKFFSGKCMDVYRYIGVIRSRMSVCPWCRKKHVDNKHLVAHISSKHNKYESTLFEYRMQLDLYRLLLEYCRNGNYDAMSFLTQSVCQLCSMPLIDSRKGKCAIPESSRNKPRSFKILNFICDGFKWKDFDHNHCAIVYRRHSV